MLAPRVASGARGRVVEAALTLLVSRAGLGKTLVFGELARIEVTYGVRTLVVAPREELIEEARATLEALGVLGL